MSPLLTRLEVLHFRHVLPDPKRTPMGPMRHRPALLLRLEDAEGAEGWGEIWCNFPPDGDLHRARMAANVAPAALDGLTADTDRPFATIRQRLHRLALQAGEPGPVSQVAAGFDIALGDLAARRAGLPLARYLGGDPRPLPAYASGIGPDEHGDRIAAMRKLGYRRFKMRVGFGPDDGLSAAEEAAGGLNDGERLMLDANQAWDLAAARAQCERVAPLDPIWMEEPLPSDAAAADWAALASAAAMPLAGGENLGNRAALDATIGQAALRFLQPDICKWGGLSGVAEVARAALDSGLTYCPHFLGGGVGLVASAHLLSAVGGDGMLEVDSSENPLLAIFSGGLALEDGAFVPPDGAGIGPVPDIAAAQDMLISRAEVAL